MLEITAELIIVIVVGVIAGIVILSGIRTVRPTHRGIVETLGKYSRFQGPGLTFIIPVIQRMYTVDITEQLITVDSQEVITKDNLNCYLSAQVYLKVNEDEQNVKNVFYKVTNYKTQLSQLAQSTLRNVIGGVEFQTVNSERKQLNTSVFDSISKQITTWGISVLRIEVKEIVPPKDVQETMNMVIKAQNDKQSAIDFANATETRADGDRRARIKEAEGKKKAMELEAEGQANAILFVAEANAKQIKLINESAERYFINNAQTLKRLEVTQASLEKNSKVIITENGISPTIVINESKDSVIPITQSAKSVYRHATKDTSVFKRP